MIEEVKYLIDIYGDMPWADLRQHTDSDIMPAIAKKLAEAIINFAVYEDLMGYVDTKFILETYYIGKYDSPAEFAKRYYQNKLIADEPPDDVPEYIWLALRAVNYNDLAPLLCNEEGYYYENGHVFKFKE